MSNPQDPQHPADHQPEDVPPTDAPTAASPIGDAPTQAYPPAAPHAAYGGPGVPPAPPGFGGPGPVPGGGPAYGAPPKGPDTRPKTLGWIALGVGVLTIVLATIGVFTSALPLGVIVAIIALLIGVVGVVLGIVVLVNGKQGNKLGGVLGLVASVLGGGTAVVALVFAIVIGIASTVATTANALPSASPSSPSGIGPSNVGPTGTPGAPDEDDADVEISDADEQAYLDEVRPQIDDILREIDPSGAMEGIYTDEDLLLIGESFAEMAAYGSIEDGRDIIVQVLVGDSGGVISEDQANRFFDVIAGAADRYLVG